MLPYTDHLPARSLEAEIRVPIAPNVRLDFFAPPIRVGLGPRAMLRASVPKTTVEEDSDPLCQKGDVYGSSASLDELAVQSEAKTPSMQFRAQGSFAQVVTLRRSRHPFGCLG